MTTARTSGQGPGFDAALLTPYATVRETHSAVVVFIGSRVMKVRKPVDLGFLDFTSREKRLNACRREVELNRRLAPDVYLGVADVHGPDGQVMEHLVAMRRLPDSLRLATMVGKGTDMTGHMHRIARQLASFHAGALRSPDISAQGGRDALGTRWAALLTQLARFEGTVVDAEAIEDVRYRFQRFLAGRGDLFADRQERGRIVDGHGDLLAEDVFCLADGPRILDCLDFDDALRYVDVLDDLAFLAMDLERLGVPELAAHLVAEYLELSADPGPPQLIHHYVAYRAVVRSMVACLRHEQSGTGAEEARQLLELARRHLNSGAVRLVLVGGPPGTGKSALATGLADRLGLCVLSSDRLRKELAGVPAETSLSAPFLAGAYTPEWTRRTYEQMLRRAELLLGRGESVVLDATWSDPEQRAAADRLADHAAADLVQVRCTVAPEVARARAADRVSVSDATSEVADRIGVAFPHWPEAFAIATDQPVDVSVDEAAAVVLR